MKSREDNYVDTIGLSQYQKLAEKEKQLEIINDFIIELTSKISIDEVVWCIAKNVVARLGFIDCVIYLYDAEEQVLIQKAAHGPKNPIELDIKNPIKISLGQGIVGTAALTKQGEIVSDTREDSRYVIDDDFRLSEISVPIFFEGQIIGVIDSEHTEVGFYTEEHLRLLKSIAAISATKIMHAFGMGKIQEYQKNLEQKVSEKTIELQETIVKLKKSNADLESFAYAASHDLQEPIRTIASYLQLIKKREKNLSVESHEFIEFAIDGSVRMRKLLEGLLAYSKLKKVGEQLEVVDVDHVVEVVKANLHTRIQELGAQIHFKNLGQIIGDRTQILQLFQNLISNAIKFKKSDKSPVIEISVVRKEKENVYEIRDEGIGINPDFFDKIFNLFSRLNTIDKFSGSGIGLALCKKIIENHNGSIEVKSEINVGTSFFLSFPIMK